MKYLALLAWLPLAANAVGALAQEAPRKRPNVLFLLTDDQRADTIHALGNPAIQTPNLDRLARASMVFRNAYCMGGSVPAVCLPSRVMLLSGRSLFHVSGDLRADYAPNWPQTFRDAGYETYHHGKKGNSAQAIQAHFEHNRYLKNDDQERRSGRPGKEIADPAIEFLTRSRDKARPFFMYLAFGNPHDPRVVIPEYRAKYEDAAVPLPKNFLPFHPLDNGEMTVRDEALAPWPRTPAVVRQHLADLYGVITYLDMQIGRILDGLKASGEYDNTIILFSSDQGLAIGSHGLFGKQNLYEDGMKVPLLIAGPGITAGPSDALVYLFDVFPTVCDLTGVPVPAGLDGRSFAAVVRGQSTHARGTIFLAYRDVQRAVRQGDWKLIRYPKINRTQLFDLANDPYEVHDLAAEPAQRARVAQLEDRLAKEQQAFDDPAPLSSDNPRPAEVTPEFFKREPSH